MEVLKALTVLQALTYDDIKDAHDVDWQSKRAELSELPRQSEHSRHV